MRLPEGARKGARRKKTTPKSPYSQGKELGFVGKAGFERGHVKKISPPSSEPRVACFSPFLLVGTTMPEGQEDFTCKDLIPNGRSHKAFLLLSIVEALILVVLCLISYQKSVNEEKGDRSDSYFAIVTLVAVIWFFYFSFHGVCQKKEKEKKQSHFFPIFAFCFSFFFFSFRLLFLSSPC